MNEALLVEVLGADILALTACMVIDAQVFPRPSVQFAQELMRPYARVWVVRTAPERTPFGFLAAHQVGTDLHIVGLAIDPSARRRGGARALLAAATAHARRGGMTRVTLEVNCANEPAISLYEGLGFSPVKTLLRYYAGREHAFSMVLLLGKKPRNLLPPRRAPRS